MIMETERAELLVTAEQPEVEGQPKEAGRRLSRSSTVTEGGLCAALRVVRAKGLVWVASQQSHCYMGMASLAGRRFDVTYGAMWHAARVDSSRSASQPWPNLSPGFHTHWEEPWGDRRTELVVHHPIQFVRAATQVHTASSHPIACHVAHSLAPHGASTEMANAQSIAPHRSPAAALKACRATTALNPMD
jgi:hypothetical protein